MNFISWLAEIGKLMPFGVCLVCCCWFICWLFFLFIRLIVLAALALIVAISNVTFFLFEKIPAESVERNYKRNEIKHTEDFP